MKYNQILGNTPQTSPLIGVPQIKNNAGGHVFEVSSLPFLERFLTLGTEGGTYYVSESKLTIEAASNITALIKSNGLEVVSTLLDFARSNRVFKKSPLIFTLALTCAYGNAETKKAAYEIISKVCTNSTDIFSFCETINLVRGWSRGLRTGVANFYTSKTEDEVAYQLVKYRQRNGWTHKDVMRLSHPQPTSASMNSLFSYAVGKAETVTHPLLKAFEDAQSGLDAEWLVPLIHEFRLSWEMVPTDSLKEPEVLWALLQHMPMHAMLRNLNRFAMAGVTDSNSSEATRFIVQSLSNREKLVRSKLHPITILNAMHTYARGYGFRGSNTWTPNQSIVDALELAFHLSFDYDSLTPTKKNILIAVDVSGSMQAPISNMALNCSQAASALALSLVKSEPLADVVAFNTKAFPVVLGKRSSYEEALRVFKQGGGTDCAAPYDYATTKHIKYDAIIILTDNETWTGSKHPVQAFENFCSKVNQKCKTVVVGMASNTFSLFDGKDARALNVAGFDASIPELINHFIRS